MSIAHSWMWKLVLNEFNNYFKHHCTYAKSVACPLVNIFHLMCYRLFFSVESEGATEVVQHTQQSAVTLIVDPCQGKKKSMQITVAM